MNWDYLAGIFDGEGHTRWDFSWNRTSIKASWQVTNQNQRVIDEIALFLIEHDLTPRFQPNREKHCAVVYVYRINEVEWLLEKLRPLVIVKREQIDEVLQVIRNRPLRKSTYQTKKKAEILARTQAEISFRQRPVKKHKTGAKLK